MKWHISALLPVLALAIAANADEIRLKDDSKIIGTIVGFENGAFKVQTAYGFAFVRKTSIVEIVPSDSTAASSTGSASANGTPAPSSATTKPHNFDKNAAEES